VNIPANYTLTFTVTPTGTLGTYGSLLHYSGNGQDVNTFPSRAPDIYFFPGTTRISVVSSVQANPNYIFHSSVPLPIGFPTKVTLVALGSTYRLLLNDTLRTTAINASPRYSGPAIFYGYNKLNSKALANLGPVEIRPFEICHLAATDVAITAIGEKCFLRTPVPSNFRLSFSIRPTRFSNQLLSNIISFRHANESLFSNGVTIPSVFFAPGGVPRLTTISGNPFTPNWIMASSNVPINVFTNVVLEANGSKHTLYFNGTLVTSFTGPSSRFTGQTFLHLGDSNPLGSRFEIKFLNITSL
jgi:hypothetical protein